MRTRVFSTVLPAAALLLTACGGTEDAPRPDPEPVEWLEPLDDPGSAPPDCSADDGYDILLVEDWETGAGTGWYSNNEYCQPCSDIQDELDDVGRPAKCLALEGNVETGCNPDAVGDAAAAARRDVRAAIRYYLPEADPDEDELASVIGSFDACVDTPVVSDEGEVSPAESECAGEDLFQKLLPKVRRGLAQAQRLQADFAECRVPCDPTQSPPAMAKPFPAEEIPGGRCGSTMAAHVELHRRIHREGTLGRQFPPTAPFDASRYDGVSFWLRVVPGSRNTFRISVPDRFTDEKFEVDGEPPCRFINPKELTDNSCDKFGRFFLASNDWEFFTIPFDEMRQNGFGKQAPYFDIANLMGLALEYKQGQWDYWIDDIGFNRKK
jgi:hypothetical protein